MKSFRKHLSEVAAVKPRKAPKKFPGYWAGKDSAKASRSKMVGGESVTPAPSGQDYLKEFENFKEQGVTEAPIEMDPAEPMNPMIHNHQGANPAKLQYRMARAAAQFKELAKRAENGSAIGWESIARQFGELAMNVEQIKHGLDELAAIRKKGGRGSRGIDPNIGEAAPVVPGAPVPGAVPDPIEVKKAQIQKTQSGKLASVVGANPAALGKALTAASNGISTPATAQAFLPTLDDIAKLLQDPTLGPQFIALLAKAKQIK